MMQKVLSILALSLAPIIAMAGGNHAGGHGAATHGTHGHAAPHAHAPVGQPGDPSRVTRTIEVDMHDNMRFTPDEIPVRAGETIRFVVKNSGQLTHEMVIGSLDELKTHAQEMLKHPDMQHDEPNAITLHSGGRGSLVWLFDQAGTVDFACTLPGHMEGGMVGRIKVG